MKTTQCEAVVGLLVDVFDVQLEPNDFHSGDLSQRRGWSPELCVQQWILGVAVLDRQWLFWHLLV